MTATEFIAAALRAQAVEAEKRQREEKRARKKATRKQLSRELSHIESLAASLGISAEWLKAEKVTYQKTGKKHDGRMSTVVSWADGTKTVVICAKGDTFDPFAGLMLCYMKKISGNTSSDLKDILSPAAEYKKAVEERGAMDAFTVAS